MIKKELLLLIGLMISLLGSSCYDNPSRNNGTILIPSYKDSIPCIVARQLPYDDGPNKSPYIPHPTTDVYISRATGTAGPTASGTVSPSLSSEA